MKTPLFVTATGRNAGKTIVTLGLTHDLSQNYKVGFIKPVGLARVRAGTEALDVDAMLIEKTCQLHENIKDMCPVTLSQSDWPEVSPADVDVMLAKVRESYGRISEGRDVIVVEGTGSAALGTAMGLPNARVAAELGCKALLVAPYGTMITNPFDVAALSKEYFKASGVETIGAVINRVPADLMASYEPYARKSMERVGIPLRGLIPESPALGWFRFLQVSEYLDGEMLCGTSHAEAVIDTVRIGAMTPHRALAYFAPKSLIITPGDREDIIVTACACSQRNPGGPSGLVLSGGQRPHDRIIELLKESGIPTFLASEDSYTVGSKIHDMPLRIQPTDTDKISTVQQLTLDHLEVEAILGSL
ncbi:MAG: AAA family ATPase [Planctomycetota bacterium]